MEISNLISRYNINIYERLLDLIKAGKNIDELDYKNDLHKIFEWFSCIKLTLEYEKPYYEYSDINPDFKEERNMTRNDTGIDFCNLIDTIGQCKLRTDKLNWSECSTFFASNFYRDKTDNKFKSKWSEMIITRNSESTLSLNLKSNSNMFLDKTYPRTEIISYCKNLLENPPSYPNPITENIFIRDYQQECIDLIKNTKGNLILCLPTGTGKNFILAHSLTDKIKYLILVPRIILMDQIKDEIIQVNPKMKRMIQLIGNSNNEYNNDKIITICIFNSVKFIKKYIENFDKIIVDEAHHINKPEIYKNYDDDEDIIDDDFEDDEDEVIVDDDKDEDENKDEDDDESCDNTKYIKIIKEFRNYNNNIYLSATIDEIENFTYYKKDIRDMINSGYLCDYEINIPIFSDDPSNQNICEYLINNYRNVIIYCNSQKEGKVINKLMNKIQIGCSEYIDCSTSKNKRNDILNKYKTGDIPFIVNVKILVEGFNAPITKGICFMHLPSNSTTLIQIIGRALRLHPLKKIANIILPFSSVKDGNDKTINNFIKIMAKNDNRIYKSYQERKLGGYISIDKSNEDLDDESSEKNNLEIKYELIYDSLGQLTNGYGFEHWYKRLEQVKKYIDENSKKPYKTDKDPFVRKLSHWIGNNVIQFSRKIYIMKNVKIYDSWLDFTTCDKYKSYFLDNITIWENNFIKLNEYIDKNNKFPNDNDVDLSVKKLSAWLSTQIYNFKNKKLIMKNEYIYTKWYNFTLTDKYITISNMIKNKSYSYFDIDIKPWINNLEKVKDYIIIHKHRPFKSDKDINVKKLGEWLSVQLFNFNNKVKNMLNEEIYNEFNKFINDELFNKYFLDNTENWLNIFQEVKLYMDTYKKRPNNWNPDIKIKRLGKWISGQMLKFKTKKDIMKDAKIYKIWYDFINDDVYKEYFLDNNTIWINTLEKVINYIDNNNKLPSSSSKDKEVKILGAWIIEQNKNYKNKNHILKDINFYNKWDSFINDDKYSSYFLDNKTIWLNKFEKVNLYIKNNNKLPSYRDTDIIIRAYGNWIRKQNENYKLKTNAMKDIDIYQHWTNFKNINNKYF